MALDFPATERQSRVRMVPEELQNLADESEPIPRRDRNSGLSGNVYPTQVLATFSTLAKVLGARAILLLATVGAFVLAYISMGSPSYSTMALTAIYDGLVLLPIVVLTAMRN